MHCRQRTTRNARTGGERGAALIVAIGILTVLVVIALTFFQMARQELDVATNVSNQMRADLMAEGATALAISHLTHDLEVHPTYTSLDHGWRTFFNGAWAVDKDWLWVDVDGDGIGDSIDPNRNVNGARGIPEVRLDQNALVPAVGVLVDPPDLGDQLYYPRQELIINRNGPPDPADTYTDALNPFLITTPVLVAELTRAEQIDQWADVDNDDDGLNDSVWLPIPADKVFVLGENDGIDNNLNGATDEEGEPDGLDNDLDGVVDEDGEVAVFLYWGYRDGLDNDGDGVVDEGDGNPLANLTLSDEDIPYLTVPLFYQIPPPGARILVLDVAAVMAATPFPAAPLFTDAVDNDNNFIVNNYQVFVIDPNAPESVDNPVTIAQAHHRIDPAYLSAAMLAELAPGEEVWAAGEPVTEIVGRMAILINDESSKVNLNAVGGYAIDEIVSPTEPLHRTMSEGSGLIEYDPRVLPSIDVSQADHLWTLRMGSPNGIGFRSDPIANPEDSPFLALAPPEPQNAIDTSAPGLGRVDDNGNLLQLAFNRIDDDGDALRYRADGIDNDFDSGLAIGDTVDNDLDGLFDAADFGADEGIDEFGEDRTVASDEGHVLREFDGAFAGSEFGPREGLDEPAEFQEFQPLRNAFAETDTLDNDNDALVDEPGELGDRILRTYEQAKLVTSAAFPGSGITETIFGTLKSFVTVHSADKNFRYNHSADGNLLLDPAERSVTGLKLDYNFAMADDVARAIRDDFGYGPSLPEPDVDPRSRDDVRFFTAGLRQADTDVVVGLPPLPEQPVGFLRPQPVPVPPPVFPVVLDPPGLERFPADLELRAAQLAASIHDYRDRDHQRTEVETRVVDEWWTEAERADPLDLTLANGAGATDQREISYTAAGIESIRINEIMVRPVRRIEVESYADPQPDPFPVAPTDDIVARLNPNAFQQLPPISAADPPLDFRLRVHQIDPRYVTDPAPVPGGRFTSAWEMFPDPSDPLNTNTIGWETVFRTTEATIEIPHPDPLVPGTTVAPNIIEFSFIASDQLPPGRYYLVLNTTEVDPQTGERTVTVLQPGAFEFATKYVRRASVASFDTPPAFATSGAILRVDNQSVIEDVTAAIAASDARLENNIWDSPIVGYGGANDAFPTGWVFLPPPEPDPLLVDPVYDGYFQNGAFTVEILPYLDPFTGLAPATPADVIELHVAIRLRQPSLTAEGRLAVNFFEFSQEPDHEWVEIVNIAEVDNLNDVNPDRGFENFPLPDQDYENAVDLSGWQLVVGAEGDDAHQIKMRIPDETWIAPGGMLLLAVNGFDGFTGGAAAPGLLYNNGIGLAGGIAPYANVTTPFYPLGVNSVFQPPTPFDFVDMDGNGLDDSNNDGNLFRDDDNDGDPLTAQPPVPMPIDWQLPSKPGLPNKAWDRIIELEVPEFRSPDLATLAKLVLGGGVFPNYPERDGIDNDADAAVLLTDQVDNDGDGFIDETAANDWIDNDGDSPAFTSNGIDDDGDGVIDDDSYNDNIDNDGDGFIDEPFEVDPVAGIPEGVDEPGETDPCGCADEGFDEGRWDPAWTNRETADFPADPPGSGFAIQTPSFEGNDRYSFPYRFDPDGTGPLGPTIYTEAFAGSNDDPLEWRIFEERRWYPGDNVIVSLYAPASTVSGEPKHLVDRVTYTELDVVNRAMDDILGVDIDGDGVNDRRALDAPNLDSPFWPPDTMSVDFYKSLERRHPLYAGDLHGTQNRWEATDGNYDDWADRVSRWEREHDYGIVVAPTIVNRSTDPRSNLFTHAYDASPLRMNYTQRLIENPRLFVPHPAYPFNPLKQRQLENNDRTAINPPERLIPVAEYVDNVRWAFDTTQENFVWSQRNYFNARARVRDAELISTANLLGMPHFRRIRDFSSFASAGARAIGMNESLVRTDPITLIKSQRYRQDISTVEVMLGQNELFGVPPDPNFAVNHDASAVLTIGTIGVSIPLSVAQADVFPLTPDVAPFPLYQWGLLPLVVPQGWVPVLSYELPNDALAPLPVPFQTRYLLNFPGAPPVGDSFGMPAAPGLPPTLDVTRSPQATRALMYASRNLNGFSDTTPHTDGNGAEVLFVWDAEDGIKNGEYEVFLEIGPSLDPLWDAYIYGIGLPNLALPDPPMAPYSILTDFSVPSPPANPGITDFGELFVNRARGTETEKMEVDVEVFTDRDGTGSVTTVAVPLSPADLDRADDSLGQRHGLSPGPDALVRFGLVTVENNMLGVMLRNRTPAGSTVRFTRVILAPRDRTPGRINVNTAQTARLAGPDAVLGTADDVFFNPLMGMPGVLEPPAAGDDVTHANPVANSTAPDGFVTTIRDLSAQIMNNRARPGDVDLDGRYYQFTSGLASEEHNKPLRIETPDPVVGPIDPLAPVFAGNVFDEVKFRLERMQNLITTRSDLFEILVTIETGYVVDENGDGRFNYRDDNEFRPDTRKRVRTVYER